MMVVMHRLKGHVPIHFSDQVLDNGIFANVDTEAGESNHKENSKKTAQMTQKQS
jgi:hypothetical protein